MGRPQGEVDAAGLHHPAVLHHHQQLHQQQEEDAIASSPGGTTAAAAVQHQLPSNAASFSHKYYASTHLGNIKWKVK